MSGLALSLAGALHQQGAAIVNPYPASAALRDKIIASRVLQAAGVPTPATYVALHPDQLAPLLAEGPLAVKPCPRGAAPHVRIDPRAPQRADVDTRGRQPVLRTRYPPHAGRAPKSHPRGHQ